MMKIILDVDCGIDDSLAILYLLGKKEIEVLGITSVFGNVSVQQSADNVCRLLDLAGAPADISVVAGATVPLDGVWDGPVTAIHGDNGLGNVELPCSGRKLLDMPVEDFFHEVTAKYPGEVTVITLGRLTNIANTLEKHPEFAENVRNIVMMGGTLYHCGNVTPVAEANIEGDPLACDRVFCSGIDVAAVGLDVTMKTRLKRDNLKKLAEYCSEQKKPIVEYLCQAFDYYFEGNRRQDGCVDDCPIHDPLAAIAAVRPELFTFQSMKAHIECGGEYCRGMVVTDRRAHSFDAEYVKFAVDVESEDAVRELLSVFLE